MLASVTTVITNGHRRFERTIGRECSTIGICYPADVHLRSLAISGTLSCTLFAAPTSVAEESRPVFIWYRSAGECPDGDAFLSKLSGKVTEARIAAAGDPIDFVVTLGSLGSRSNGRLERETTQGKVAIREIDSENCAEVAEALALSLALAIDPSEKPAVPEEPAPAPSQKNPTTTRAPTTSASDPKLDRAPPRNPENSSWWVGAQGTVASAIAPSALPGGLVFVELERARASVLPGSSLRLGALGRFGTLMTNVGDVRYRLLGGRIDACPLRIGSNTLAVKPCAGFDLGQLEVEGTNDSGLGDRALWAAAGVNGRLTWRAAGALAFELDAGAFAPLTRYTLETGDPTLAGDRTDFMGFTAGLGASVLLP